MGADVGARLGTETFFSKSKWSQGIETDKEHVKDDESNSERSGCAPDACYDRTEHSSIIIPCRHRGVRWCRLFLSRMSVIWVMMDVSLRPFSFFRFCCCCCFVFLFLCCCGCGRVGDGSCRRCVSIVCIFANCSSPCAFENTASSSSCFSCMTTRSRIIVVFHVVLLVTAHNLSYYICRTLIHVFNDVLSCCRKFLELEGSIGFGCDHDHDLY